MLVCYTHFFHVHIHNSCVYVHTCIPATTNAVGYDPCMHALYMHMYYDNAVYIPPLFRGEPQLLCIYSVRIYTHVHVCHVFYSHKYWSWVQMTVCCFVCVCACVVCVRGVCACVVCVWGDRWVGVSSCGNGSLSLSLTPIASSRTIPKV